MAVAATIRNKTKTRKTWDFPTTRNLSEKTSSTISRARDGHTVRSDTHEKKVKIDEMSMTRFATLITLLHLGREIVC